MTQTNRALTIITFRLQEHWFGIPLQWIEGVSPLGETVAIPGNRSRTIRGLSYVSGKIMVVVDLAPIMNLRGLSTTGDSLVVKHQDVFYAIPVTEVGSVLSGPKLSRTKDTHDGAVISEALAGTRRIRIIGVPTLLERHVLTHTNNT